ncbi:hypothetical protein BFP97_06575 [Roseivirga sp. 4D4]|uniref:hypothetical protein n=1 Tax=Roseivirga sp. 4D4 TaxID=1889784 RepID=UPI00085351C9|nr:hypothetical protein [Roseivirga sp. 4D4]OEK01194.1 hypothetical protein BFP97_06575 [Roseivirga sp. 4D4]
MHINPTPEQQQQFMEMPDIGPLFMINMLKFKTAGLSKYQAYIKAVAPLIVEVGAELVWSGQPMGMLIGPHDARLWDAVLIVKYPNKMALAQLGGHPDYPGHLRTEALADSRLIACTEMDFLS